MEKVKGINFIVEVNTGTESNPTFTKVAGQQGATLNRSANTLETTTKDSNGWMEHEVGFKEWGIDTDGLIVVDDNAYKILEDAFMDGKKLDVRIATPAGETYGGKVIITDFPLEFPYDDNSTYSVTFQGSGELKRGIVA